MDSDQGEPAPPWLEGFDGDRGALLEQLLEFICRPAFGSRSKREIEIEVVRLLYEGRIRAGSLTIGEIADALAISRSKARGYMQEVRARMVAGATPADRRRILFEAMVHWPLRGQLEQDRTTERLRVVVEDSYLRDLLKTHAYREGVVLDASFSSEIVTLSWAAYERLFASLLDDATDAEALNMMAADVRQVLADDEEALQAFNDELESLRNQNLTARQKVIRGAKLVAGHVPTMITAAGAVAAL